MVLLIRPSSPDRPTARGLAGEQSTRELFHVRLCSRTKRGLKRCLSSRSRRCQEEGIRKRGSARDAVWDEVARRKTSRRICKSLTGGWNDILREETRKKISQTDCTKGRWRKALLECERSHFKWHVKQNMDAADVESDPI